MEVEVYTSPKKKMVSETKMKTSNPMNNPMAKNILYNDAMLIMGSPSVEEPHQS